MPESNDKEHNCHDSGIGIDTIGKYDGKYTGIRRCALQFGASSECKGNDGLIYGCRATWLSCTLPLDTGRREVLLRSPDMAEHMKQTAYFGTTVGRYANRIDGGRFSINGEEFQLSQNEGNNILHGGKDGFDKRRWTIEHQTETSVTFGLALKDGDQAFPAILSRA